MAKSEGQKSKLLYLVKILREESDKNNLLTVNDIIEALAVYGISVERKTVYDDINILVNFGYDIVTVRQRSNLYYLKEREFETAELKLLIDAVQSAKFITERKSRRLIKKLNSMASKTDAVAMNRQVYVQGRTKTTNEEILNNVDLIHHAINSNSAIECAYFEWLVDSKATRRYRRSLKHEGKAYLLSPWALLWDNEYYYLLAFDHTAEKIKHFRADKLERVKLINEARQGEDEFKKLDIASYSKKVFDMFGGKEESVTLRFSNRLIGVVIDRFGKEVFICTDGKEHFRITVDAVVSPKFFSWLMGFGSEVKVISPHWVATKLVEQAREVIGCYGGEM